MKRFKEINLYRKIFVLLTAAVFCAFTGLYIAAACRAGYEYKGRIFVPAREEDRTCYYGRIGGESASFTLYDDGKLYYSVGDRLCGPYERIEDPEAVPTGLPESRIMTGVELRCDGRTVFRGGYIMSGDGVLASMYREDGSFYASYAKAKSRTLGWGTDPASPEPSLFAVLELLKGPELTRKGRWGYWAMGTLVCLLGLFILLYEEERFAFALRLHVRDAEKAEPTAWTIAMRYVAWTLFPFLAAGYFVLGLL